MNIAVLLDGTWRDREDGTNIAQLWERLTPEDSLAAAQRVHYNPGVGTSGGVWSRLTGGALGHGLEDDITDSYRFIAEHHHSEDDRICLLGYSRGAFSARSLAGMIAKCGLVDPSDMSAKEVFARYQRNKDAPGLQEMQNGEAPPVTAEDRLILERSRLVRISFIGLFDTVGRLGIPGGIGRALSRRRYQFHDTALSGLIDHACHAVAIDEHRKQFAPTLWTGAPTPSSHGTPTIEQRWFIGSHSNIGGGTFKDGTSTDDTNTLSALSREWIAERASAAGLEIKPPTSPLTGEEWRGPIRASFSRFLGGLGQFLPGNKPYLRPVRTAVGETLDSSILSRWGPEDPPYQPNNPNLSSWVQETAAGRAE
ncbi:DUF2235 domain-containing protein [Nesterenkonia sp. NBAIMH1]|uniref:DUF2235 domain-containing protein n=1 Tax=Nesterenkonia sp. NBAIMH1 TaxID=2600320 RepID=UPI0011B4E3FD|nr:DUF2235 domain-containing protein [Nesterenkonia sp. NBAIMH1]